MTRHARVELRDLHLTVSIGTYGPDDVVPNAHILDQSFETQEYLITLITRACAAYRQIEALEISLKKQPVLADSGTLGVWLSLGSEDLVLMRQDPG